MSRSLRVLCASMPCCFADAFCRFRLQDAFGHDALTLAQASSSSECAEFLKAGASWRPCEVGSSSDGDVQMYTKAARSGGGGLGEGASRRLRGNGSQRALPIAHCPVSCCASRPCREKSDIVSEVRRCLPGNESCSAPSQGKHASTCHRLSCWFVQALGK